MIVNISYHTLELKQLISETVGGSFSMLTRFKLKGIGSQRYRVAEASEQLWLLFGRDNAGNFCNIELRKQGIIIRFRSKQETFGWLIPYRKLTIYKSGSNFSVYDGKEKIRLQAAHNAKLNGSFIRKLISVKADAMGDSAPSFN
jgi:hypothetical protein